MKLVWDPDKAANNLLKHGVSFEEAETIFADPLAISYPDPRHSLEEERWLIYGMSASSRLLVVSYSFRGEDVRLISGRLATRIERVTYEEG